MSLEVAQMDVADRLTVAIKRIAIMRGALASIGMQQKTDELDEPENADFEGAYDSMIDEARTALAATRE